MMFFFFLELRELISWFTYSDNNDNYNKLIVLSIWYVRYISYVCVIYLFLE